MTFREFRYQSGQVVPGTNVRIIRPLGYGGMGAVYECEQTFTEQRYVLKVIHPDLVTGKGMLARMQNEAKVLAKLKHPNIIQIYWAGLTDESPKLFYYVMEKLDGYSLRRLARKARERNAPLRIDSVLRIIASLLNALAHAHQHGIIHRDVKPDNVFVHTGDLIKLLDFGIVVEQGKRRTTARGFVGTLSYAAPEQILGGDLSPATDLWAVGAMLHELLTGQGPFEAAQTEVAMAQANLTIGVQRPSILRPEVPPALDALILRLLEKDPARRMQDALEVAAQLDRIRGEVIEAPAEELDMTGPVLMEEMGPPSMSNVDEEFEEDEEPPSSDSTSGKGSAQPSRDARMGGDPAHVMRRSPRQPGGQRPQATDRVTPSMVDRAVRKAQTPAPPRPDAAAGQRSVAPPPMLRGPHPHEEPSANLSDASSLPWGGARRVFDASPTLQSGKPGAPPAPSPAPPAPARSVPTTVPSGPPHMAAIPFATTAPAVARRHAAEAPRPQPAVPSPPAGTMRPQAQPNTTLRDPASAALSRAVDAARALAMTGSVAPTVEPPPAQGGQRMAPQEPAAQQLPLPQVNSAGEQRANEDDGMGARGPRPRWLDPGAGDGTFRTYVPPEERAGRLGSTSSPAMVPNFLSGPPRQSRWLVPVGILATLLLVGTGSYLFGRFFARSPSTTATSEPSNIVAEKQPQTAALASMGVAPPAGSALATGATVAPSPAPSPIPAANAPATPASSATGATAESPAPARQRRPARPKPSEAAPKPGPSETPSEDEPIGASLIYHDPSTPSAAHRFSGPTFGVPHPTAPAPAPKASGQHLFDPVEAH